MARIIIIFMTMKRYIIVLATLLLSAALSAQEYPQMKELKESALTGQLHSQMRKDKWGFANIKDNFVIKPVFDEVEEFRVVKETTIDTILMARVWVGGKVGLLKRNGTYFLTPEFDEISDFTSQDIAYFTKDGKYGFADVRSGICSSGMDEIQPFDGKEFAWFKEGESWGAVTLMGRRIIRASYDACPVPFHGILYLASKDGKVGLVDSKSYSEAIPVAYDDLLDLDTDGLVLAKTEGRSGCLKLDGSTVLEPEFETLAFDPVGKLFFAAKDGKTGVYNAAGEQIVGHILASSPDFSRGPVRIFDAGTPRLLFRNGDYVSAQNSRYEASFPYYLRPGYYASLNDYASLDDSWGKWLSDCPTLGIPEAAPSGVKHLIELFNDIKLAYIEVNRNKVVSASDGPVFCNDNNIADLTFTPKGAGPIKIGALITKFFTGFKPASVDNFDKVYGTDFASEWTDMDFDIFLCEPFDGKFLLGMNIYLSLGSTGTKHLNTSYAIVDAAGKVYNSWSVEGELLNPSHYTAANQQVISMLEDGTLLYSGRYCSLVNNYYEENILGFTEVRDRTGKLICHVDDGMSLLFVKNDTWVAAIEEVEAPDSSMSALLFTPGDWACKKVDITDYLFDNCIVFPEPLNPDVLKQEGSGFVLGLMPVDDQIASVPALKYWPDDWGGTEVHSFGVTLSPNFESAPSWVTRFGRLEPGIIEIRPDLSITIEDVNEDGLARYSYEVEGSKHYGYVGDGCFTQAIYSESTPFVDGKAEVRLGGTIRTLTREEILVPADFAPATGEAGDAAAEAVPASEEAVPFQLVDEKPSFNGGDANEFSKWVTSQLQYPESASQAGIEGRVVLQFTVCSDGHVDRVKVIRGVDPALDQEAVRVVSMSPDWKPGYQSGRAVAVTYTFPVIFQKKK